MKQAVFLAASRAAFSAKVAAQGVVRRGLLAAFSGGTCTCCGGTSGGRVLCPRCADAFLQAGLRERPTCFCCGKPLVSEEGMCMSCREQPVFRSTQSVTPLFAYRLWRKNLLFEWKMRERRELTPLFAQALSSALGRIGCKTVVPVPPRPGKVHRRGWDQVSDVCQFLAMRHGVTVVPLLERVSGEQQKKKDREGRLTTTGSSYRPSRRHSAKSACIPQEAVLIDDVITTGATAECCAALLRGMGVRKVHVLSLFIVD